MYTPIKRTHHCFPGVEGMNDVITQSDAHRYDLYPTREGRSGTISVR